jgi:urea ABC transporter ATP-binding protein UrtE
MTGLLQVTDIVAGYDGGTVLDGVSIAVKRGEIVALIGRNGVGKTTLMRALIGLVLLTRGSIRLEGEEVGGEPPSTRARRGVGYVPQGREVFVALTVKENLQVGSQANRSCAAEMMEKVTGYFPVLGMKYLQRAGTLSGGEQQQLTIARALVGAPKILLLDEPSEGIQPSIVALIGETLTRIVTESGTGVLLVEQDIGMVETVARRCCVMDKGRIIDILSKDQLADEGLVRKYLAF